ncbi:hypothetical protein SUGI_0311330 [Cryptomeria japonica]|nr:hypothetical protein SUGI_0311330 [Cryptomeria japonica]
MQQAGNLTLGTDANCIRHTELCFGHMKRNLNGYYSTKCVPNNELELTAAEAQCLRKALLNKFEQRQSSLNIQEQNAANNNRLLNFLVAILRQNCSNPEKKTEKEALEHDAEVLKFKLKDLEGKLQKSVTFLPLKDTRFAGLTDSEQTWFMSTLRVINDGGKLEFFSFPSDISNDRILCLQGRNAHDGSQNSYGFAWKMQLPINSTLLPGLTFVSDNYYDYSNPWHSLTALAGFVNWYKENECASPERFVLYHWGELVKTMGSWVSNIMHASLGRHVEVDSLEYGDGPVCFEKAVVMRRGIGRLSLDKRILLFDLIRCKVRKFCNASGGQRFINGIQVVNLTLLARTGSRSFENVSVVANVLEKECKKVSGCNFRLVHIANLTFCDQISVMSMTDILVTVHGAQLTDMIFMDKNSSVMEMFPKGWLELAGNGQYVFQWLASWSGMKHEGIWRDNEGPACPNPEKGSSHCFAFYKDLRVGHNETFLASWTADVLHKFKNRTNHLTDNGLSKEFIPVTCPCDHANTDDHLI